MLLSLYRGGVTSRPGMRLKKEKVSPPPRPPSALFRPRFLILSIERGGEGRATGVEEEEEEGASLSSALRCCD